MSSIVFFWCARDVFSNWSAHPVTMDDICYPTVEHYFVHEKALAFGDIETASRVLVAKTPAAAKRLGRSVRNYDDAAWTQMREWVMYKGLQCKTEQHPKVKEALLQTGDAMIAEASPFDKVWGIGLAREHPDASTPSKWPGRNLLGKLWMRIRADTLESANC